MKPRKTRIYTDVCFVAFRDDSWFQEKDLRKQIGLAFAQVILETTKDTNLHEYMDVQSLKETQTDFSNCFVGFRDNSWFQEKDLWKQIIN